MTWLETLVFAGEDDRLERLRGAIAVARLAPPRIVRANLPLPGDEPVTRAHFVIARDREPVAFCDPHGRWVQWLTGSRARR